MVELKIMKNKYLLDESNCLTLVCILLFIEITMLSSCWKKHSC